MTTTRPFAVGQAGARRLVMPLVALMAAMALSGCVPLLLGGAFVGGSLVAIDRRSSGTQVDDEAVELKSITGVHEAIGDRGHVSVTSYNRLALITGEVPTEADKAKVERAIAGLANVRAVVNELAVAPPSSLGTRSNDTLLTSKVKASLIDAKDIQSNNFKVVTDRGIVYLMGVVSEREAKRSADVARGVSGVVKVVRVFDIVSENALAGMGAAATGGPMTRLARPALRPSTPSRPTDKRRRSQRNRCSKLEVSSRLPPEAWMSA